jgi:hypothetical protein
MHEMSMRGTSGAQVNIRLPFDFVLQNEVVSHSHRWLHLHCVYCHYSYQGAALHPRFWNQAAHTDPLSEWPVRQGKRRMLSYESKNKIKNSLWDCY